MGFKRIPKSDAEYLHFQKRLHERYGLAFSHKAHREIAAHINTGAAKFVRRDTTRVSIFSVPITVSPELLALNANRQIAEGECIVVAYDRQRRQLITCGDVIAAGVP